ncbi:MAG: hypothetical protein ACLP19_28430 [Xanthobacteraceae bacterium]
MLKPIIGLYDAISDPRLLGGPFTSPSFWTWKTLAKLIDGIPLTEQREIDLFEQCTGRSYNRFHKRPVRRLILLAGRRAGKDRWASSVAVWRSALAQDWSKYISAGEGAVVILLGADRKQASILRRYCHGLLRSPLLLDEIRRDTDDIVEFKNGASLEIITNSASLVRGRSAIAVIGSEACLWKTDESNASSDTEVVSAAEPSMAMAADGGMLLMGSSVFRKRGWMYTKYKELFGNDDAEDICWFAPSRVMNGQLPQSVIDRALAEDHLKASAEFLNVWREGVSDFVPIDVLDAATDRGVYERPRDPAVAYVAFVDCASGLGQDSFTLGIAHCEYGTNKIVLDVLRERRPPFVPSAVVTEFAALLREYGINEVISDAYSFGFHQDEWVRAGFTFTLCENTTSENYGSFLPLLTSGRARLLDNATLRSQLSSLERVVTPANKELIRHPQTASAHDDCATAAAGAMVHAASRLKFDASWAWVSGPNTAASKAEATQDYVDRWRQTARNMYISTGAGSRPW